MRIFITICLLFFAFTSNATKITTGTPGTDISITATTVISLIDGDTLQINAGRYTGFSITSVHKRIIIIGTGVIVDFGGSTNGASITTSSLFSLYDVYFYHGTFRGMKLDGNVDSILLKISFRNFRDYVFYTTGLGTYNQTEATRNDNLDLQITSDSNSGGASVMRFENRLWNSNIHNCSIDSTFGTPIQDVEWFGKGVLFHDNLMTNINIGGVNHNSVVYAAGQFNIYNNRVINYQGEYRLRPYTMDNPGGLDTSYFVNNFSWNSVKYGQAELQQFEADLNDNVQYGFIIFANNTAGRLRDLDFEGGGSLVTLEGFLGNGYIANNVVIFPRTDADQSGLTSVIGTVINNQAGSLPQFDTSNNRFFLSWAPSGLLDSTFGRIATTSPLVNAGITVFGYNTDGDGKSRPQGGAWDIGRSEAVLNRIISGLIVYRNRYIITN